MSWNARDVSISYCSLARESHVLVVYDSVIVMFLFGLYKTITRKKDRRD